MRVNAPTNVAETVTGIKRAVYICGSGIVIILLAVTLIIIANTIKVTVFNRRKEINIMKFVGATDRFSYAVCSRRYFAGRHFRLHCLSAFVGRLYLFDKLCTDPGFRDAVGLFKEFGTFFPSSKAAVS